MKLKKIKPLLSGAATSLLACSCLAATPIATGNAQNNQNAKWTAQASAGTSFTSGNTDTFDLNADLKLKGEIGQWTLVRLIRSQYGMSAGQETRNRQFFSASASRNIRDRLGLSINTDYTLDRFSGYDYRYFIGAGLTFDVITQDETDDKLTFTIGVSPGLRVDRTTEQTVDNMTTQGEVTATFDAQLTGKLAWILSELLAVTWDTKADYIATSSGSVTLESDLAVTAKLIDSLNAKILLNQQYVAAPPQGRENLDTRLTFNLIFELK